MEYILGEKEKGCTFCHGAVERHGFGVPDLVLGDRYDTWVWYLGPPAIIAAFMTASVFVSSTNTRIILKRMPQDAVFAETTRYQREEWISLLDWLASI